MPRHFRLDRSAHSPLPRPTLTKPGDTPVRRQQGYDDVVVCVGPGLGRRQRFSGRLLAEMEQTGNERDETYRVYRTIHITDEPTAAAWR